MNLSGLNRQDNLKKHLDILGLTSKNRAMAEEYLRSNPENRELLNNAEVQSFRNTSWFWRNSCLTFLDGLIRAEEKDLAERLIRLYWAVGKSTAIFALAQDGVLMSLDATRADRIRVLGEEAEASMNAEYFSAVRPAPDSVRWLYEQAERNPEVLLQAQRLSGSDYPNMKLVLAAVALSSVVCPKNCTQWVAEQLNFILGCTIASLDAMFPDLNQAEKDTLEAYIQAGNPNATVPILDSGHETACDFTDALQVKLTDDYLCGLLGTACFLCMELDSRARCAVRVLLKTGAFSLLHHMLRMVPGKHILSRLDTLLEDLPGGRATILLYVSEFSAGMDQETIAQIAIRCAAGLQDALSVANTRQYGFLDHLIPSDAPVGEQVIALLQKSVASGAEEVYDFLTAKGDFSRIGTELQAVQVGGYAYPRDAVNKICQYRSQYGVDDFFIRCAALLAHSFGGNGLDGIFWNDREMSESVTEATVWGLLQQNYPLAELTDSMGFVWDIIYGDRNKQIIQDVMLRALSHPQRVAALPQALKKGNLFTRKTVICALDTLSKLDDTKETAKTALLSAAGETSKAVSGLLLSIYISHPEWEKAYRKLLKSKKTGERAMAAQVLGNLPGDHTKLLQAALEQEKTTKVANLISNILMSSGQGSQAIAQDGPEALAHQLLKGNMRKKIQWLMEPALPVLHRADRTEEAVSEDVRDAILVSYMELGRVGRSGTAARLAENILGKDLAMLSVDVLEKWMGKKSDSRHKWVLSFAAVFGGAEVTKLLIKAINEWPQQGRGAIACDAVAALAISSDPGALLEVDSIARKFKFRQVKAAAAEALQNAAKELNITTDELADRIVPDLGFGENASRNFDYGRRSFTVRLTPALDLEIVNDQGKTLKNMPAPGKNDDPVLASQSYEAFKTMKKQIRTTVAAQKSRLEAALAVQRCWKDTAWTNLFVKNPIMHQFAISLIWGVYEADSLITTFRYLEDGSFSTVDEDEYFLPEGGMIGLVHPVELDVETLTQWKQQLEDYEITQSIQQLDRPVFCLLDERKDENSLDDFGGIQLNGLSLAGKLMGMGWLRGSVLDGGGYYDFYREDPYMGIGVNLEFSGSYIGDDNQSVTVYDAVFYRSGTVERGSYQYDKPQKEHIYPLGKIPRRYYSEIMLQLDRATASGTERDPDWKQKKESGE